MTAAISAGSTRLPGARIGTVFLADVVTGWEYASILVLGSAIALMARGVFSDSEERRMLPFAPGSALATASGTMIDGPGARVSGDAVASVAWVFVADGLFFSTGMIAMRGWAVVPCRARA